MRQDWWKLIVVAALVAVVVVVVAAKNDTPSARTRPSGDAGLTAPVDDRAAKEAVGSPTEDALAKAAVPVKAAESDSKVTTGQPKKEPQPVVSQKGPLAKPEIKAPKAAPVEKPKPKPAAITEKKQLPKLLDLGATKCIPCKMMAPILEELAKDYKGKLDVVFIDVWKNSGESEKHGIRSIPTQIFYDENGKEFFRHEGFFAKEDILAKFKEQGIEFAR